MTTIKNVVDLDDMFYESLSLGLAKVLSKCCLDTPYSIFFLSTEICRLHSTYYQRNLWKTFTMWEGTSYCVGI